MSAGDKHIKEYATDEIVVEWDSRLCYHSHNCVRALPQVFDPDRRPWVLVDAAAADEVEAAVVRCPSGALRARRVGVDVPNLEDPLELRASANGPLLVSGGVRIVAADGTVLYEGERAALCRCGRSGNKPFCESWEGRGFGNRLAAAALDDAGRQGLDVVPLCPFIQLGGRRNRPRPPSAPRAPRLRADTTPSGRASPLLQPSKPTVLCVPSTIACELPHEERLTYF